MLPHAAILLFSHKTLRYFRVRVAFWVPLLGWSTIGLPAVGELGLAEMFVTLMKRENYLPHPPWTAFSRPPNNVEAILKIEGDFPFVDLKSQNKWSVSDPIGL